MQLMRLMNGIWCPVDSHLQVKAKFHSSEQCLNPHTTKKLVFIDFTASSFTCSGNKCKNFIIGAYNFPWEDCQFLKWLGYPNTGELRSTGAGNKWQWERNLMDWGKWRYQGKKSWATFTNVRLDWLGGKWSSIVSDEWSRASTLI